MSNLVIQESKSYINDLLSFLSNTLYCDSNISFTWLLKGTGFLKTIQAGRGQAGQFIVFDSIVSLEMPQVLDNIDDLCKAITDSLIGAIISGEYVKDESFEKKILEIEKTFENYFQDFIYEEDQNTFARTLFNELNFILKKNLVAVIKEITGTILSFIKNVDKIEASSSYDIIHIHKSDNFSLEITNKNSDYLRNLYLTINVFYLDHALEESESYISNVFDVQNSLDQISNFPNYICIPILNIKLNFLKQKWYLRKHKTLSKIENDNSLHPILVVNDEVISLHENFDFIGGNDKLIEWIKEINLHYDINKIVNPYSFKKDLKIKKIDNLNTVNNKTLRELIKYNKDVKKSVEGLLNIINEIKTRSETNPNLFLNLLYAYNCLLSLSIKKEATESEINEIYQSIIDIQNKHNIINFFADLKLLSYNVEKYLKVIENYTKGKDKNIQNITSINIDNLEEKINLVWDLFKNSCKYNRFLYYLPYEESFINSDSEEVEKIYYHSSIFLPIAYTDNNHKIKLVESKINKIKAYITSLDLVKNDINEIKIIKDEVKDSNKRIIEIVSMFTAIISFILGSVGAFSFIETFSQAMLFITLYGICISLFVGLFYFMNRGFKLHLKHLLIVLPYALIGIILYFYLLPNYQNDIHNKLEIREEKLINKKIDSIQTINNKKFKPLQRN